MRDRKKPERHGKVESRSKEIRIGSWNVCGFATDERKRLEIAEQAAEKDLDIVGVQESWEKDGGEIGKEVGSYTWIGKMRRGQKIKSRGEGGVGFLVKEHMCDVIEVISDTKFNESMWIRVPGERGRKDLFVGNVYIPPESKNMVKDIKIGFEEVAADVQNFKRKGEVVLVGDFNSRIGRTTNPHGAIGQYGEEATNKNGEEMLRFLDSSEMKVLNGRVRKTEPEWTRQCFKKGERSILDYIVVENGGKETEVRVCTTDVGTTDHALVWTALQQTRVIQSRRRRKMYRWRIDKLEVEETRVEFQEEMAVNDKKLSELIEAMGTPKDAEGRDQAGSRIIEGWEKLVNTTASRVLGRKLIVCKRAVKWWDEEIKQAIRVRRESHAKYAAGKTDAGWKEYVESRKRVKELVVKKKKGLW